MCGFIGYENSVSKTECNALGGVLHHRGPDATGYYHDKNVSFIHNRLSIIDLSNSANQPFHFNNLILIYNGEIYNYKEIRSELIKKGYSFQTNSDTEVVIKAFHCWGIDSVKHFIGMFAYCIYNKESKEIFLVRDRMGVKPLFYSLSGGLSFGSEYKTFKALELNLTINPEGLYQYFRFGFTMDAITVYNEINKLSPGYYLKYNIANKTIDKIKYWEIPPQVNETTVNKEDAVEKLEKLLINAFRYRLVSDVPVGILLSGGIDSSLLTALIQNNSSNKIKTFTIGFDHPNFDESNYARQVAKHLGTEHIELNLSKHRARDLFEKFYDIYDEPFADTSGIPTAMVTQLVKNNNVKVILSADGGDELFGGYKHYMNTFNLYKKLYVLKSLSSNGAVAFLRKQIVKYISNHYYNLEHKVQKFFELIETKSNFEFIEANFANQTNEEINRLLLLPLEENCPLAITKSKSLMEDMMMWDSKYYLPDDLLTKIDRSTMHYGIEAREPFLDHRIVEFSKTLPIEMNIDSANGKKMLRQILGKYLPANLYERPKQGFSIPIYHWFKDNLDTMFKEYLNEGSIKEIGLLNWKEIKKENELYEYCKRSGKQYNIEKMWRILSFVMWHKKWRTSN